MARVMHTSAFILYLVNLVISFILILLHADFSNFHKMCLNEHEYLRRELALIKGLTVYLC